MKKLIISISCILWVGFIFLNSSQNGKISHERSTQFANDIFKKLFSSLNLNSSQLDMLTRKFAHGFEFMILAVILIIFLNALKVSKVNGVIYSLFIVLLMATFDETLQLFVEDRTSKVTDIWIDFSGGIVGSILIGIFYGIIMCIKRLFFKKETYSD